MPELPEVQTIVATLGPCLTARRIACVCLRRNDIVHCREPRPSEDVLRALLTGRTIVSIARRAKRIIFTLDNATRFYIHLGMSGRLTLAAPDDPVPTHTHLILDFGAWNSGSGNALVQLRFTDPRRFGGLWWLGSTLTGDDGLGPEPLTLRAGIWRVASLRTRRPIKSALMDQRLIAGLGNIYVDESLFEARLHPLIPANALTPGQVQRLSRAIKTTLRRGIRRRGSTLRDYVNADGQPGAAQATHRVYGRTGLPCPVCRTPVQRIVLSGRSTHYCPKCQPQT